MVIFVCFAMETCFPRDWGWEREQVAATQCEKSFRDT